MNKILCFILLIFSLSSCTAKSSSSNNESSIKNDNSLIATDEYNDSEVVLSTSKIDILVGGFNQINVESEYAITWYIGNSELVNVEYLEGNQYQVIGLKEGKTIITAVSLNGKSSICEVNVITKEDIESINAIYSLEVDGKESPNFTTLYVVENNNGIVKYVENIYEHTISKPNPYFSAVELHFSDGVNSRHSNEYKLVGFKNNVILPNELEYGDIIICHHDHSSEHYTLPSYLNVYNLFYINVTIDQTIEFQDYLA